MAKSDRLCSSIRAIPRRTSPRPREMLRQRFTVHGCRVIVPFVGEAIAYKSSLMEVQCP